jgi:hypothetical protein
VSWKNVEFKVLERTKKGKTSRVKEWRTEEPPPLAVRKGAVSTIVTLWPSLARLMAQVKPTGPAPTTKTGVKGGKEILISIEKMEVRERVRPPARAGGHGGPKWLFALPDRKAFCQFCRRVVGGSGSINDIRSP